MSEVTDRIRRSVGSEWISSSEIGRKLGLTSSRVYTALMSDYRFGLIERKLVGNNTYWRRVA